MALMQKQEPVLFVSVPVPVQEIEQLRDPEKKGFFLVGLVSRWFGQRLAGLFAWEHLNYQDIKMATGSCPRAHPPSAGYCLKHLEFVVFSSEMLIVSKSQKMPNHTNTWGYQTATMMGKRFVKYPTMKET